MKSPTKWILTSSLVVLVLIVAGLVITSSRSTSVDTGATGNSPIAVEVTRVSRSDIFTEVVAVGSVAAMQDIMVSSETAGRVTAVYVKTGDIVQQGQVLVQVDDELKKVALDQARAQLAAAETNVQKSRKDFERTEKLFATGDVADIELEGYRLGLRSAEAQQQGALAGVRLAERQLADTRIKAPVAGVVASRKINLGEMAAPGVQVANIVDIASVKVRLSIPEEEIGRIHTGQTARVCVDPRPGEVFPGTVYSVGSKSETPSGHTYPVEIIVKNTVRDPLRVGMFARVTIVCDAARGTLAIGKDWLVGGDAQARVWVVDDSTAHQRKIVVGLKGTEMYQVVEGLKEGELVVSFGPKDLKDGARVQHTMDTNK
jgi:membrane fusion protein, multidrug efflux system